MLSKLYRKEDNANMEKLFNTISVVIGVIAGSVVYFLGGIDILLQTIIVLVILDYVTGIIKAIYLKEVSSEVGFKGILKKVTIFILISFSYFMQIILNNNMPLREIVITFFIANEGISLLENASVLVPIPQKLKDILLQLRDNNTNN